MPRVSVLIPVWNGSRYLAECLESIFSQTYTDFEIVVVNDGSTDDSAQILAGFERQDGRLRVFHQAHSGLSASLNRGLMVASGEYVARIDSDDIAFPHRLQSQVDFLDRHPEMVLVGSIYEMMDEHSIRQMVIVVPTHPLSVRWRLLFGNPIGHSTVMFRRSAAADVGGYNLQVLTCEDFDLWVRLLDKGEIGQLSSVLVRWHMES